MKILNKYIQEDCIMEKCKEKLEVGSEFKAMFINLDFELSLECDEKYMLHALVNVRKDEVVIVLNPMSVYFEEEILDMILDYWPEKKVTLEYDSNRVSYCYYTYRVFCEYHDDFY